MRAWTGVNALAFFKEFFDFCLVLQANSRWAEPSTLQHTGEAKQGNIFLP
jgi:hypothetical protein